MRRKKKVVKIIQPIENPERVQYTIPKRIEIDITGPICVPVERPVNVPLPEPRKQTFK